MRDRNSISRGRVRRRRASARESILAEIDALDRRIEADDDSSLEQEADALADEERAITQQSGGETVTDQGDQTDKSGDNWPTSASERDRLMLARHHLRIAADIIKG